MSHRLLATVAATLVLLGGCATEDPGALDGVASTTEAPTGKRQEGGADGFVPASLAWSACGRTQCATLEVPLDYDQPTGERVEIDVRRSPATGSRAGALFVNPGGPGADVADLVSAAAQRLPGSMTDRFDIVGVQPRGVAGSTRLSCGIPVAQLYAVDASLDSPADRDALLGTSRRYVEDCDRRHGDLLSHVGTRDVARDMDAVRAAMGDDQLSYLGFSYGTAIGQVYADLFPTHVRAMVLDGVLELGPSGLELAADQAAGFARALDRYVAACDASTRCAAAPDARATIAAVLAATERAGGIPAPSADRSAGPGEASLGIAYALYSETLWPALGSALRAAADGDGSALVTLADAYMSGSSFEVYFAVNCIDFAWPRDPDQVFAAARAAVARSPELGEALVNDYVRCALWPVPPQPLQATSAPDAPPIVVISTTGDPATPYEAGVAVADRLRSGVLVTNEGDGHTVVLDGKPCITRVVADYLTDLKVPPDRTVCR